MRPRATGRSPRLSWTALQIGALHQDRSEIGEAQDGLVVAQDPPAGSDVTEDDAIRLTVGSAPFADR